MWQTLKKWSGCPRAVTMDDLNAAKLMLKDRDLALVFVKDSKPIFETETAGLQGFMKAIEELDLSGSSVADRIIGKAAVHLCVYSNVKAAYAVTLSETGLKLLKAMGVSYEYEELVPTILNATKTGKCPFEKLVENIEGSREAYERIRKQCTKRDP